MNFKKIARVFFCLQSISFTLLPQDKAQDIYKGLRLVSEVVSSVEERGFRNIDFESFFQTGLKSAVASIDAHSAFITNYDKIVDMTSGNFSGIGINVVAKAPEDDFLVIIDVLEESPSELAGILPGDKIIAVDDVKIRGLSSDEVVTKIKGKRGTEVCLKIIRAKKTLEIKVKRDTIVDQSSHCYHFQNQNIYYLSLKVFAENSAKQVENLLEKVHANSDCKGIILDLRNNPGGLLEASVNIAGLFLPKGSLVVTAKNNQNKLIRSDSTHREPILNRKIHLFVLINKFTASASEILAGALKHHSEQLSNSDKNNCPIVTLIGTTTHGKGSVQAVIPLSNGCAISLTEMLYFLADDTSIQAKGVVPDILLEQKYPPSRERKWLENLFGQEQSLKRHITIEEVIDIINKKTPQLATDQDKKTLKTIQSLENKIESEAEDDPEELASSNCDKSKIIKKKQSQEELLASDYQVQTCVNMLNTIGLAQENKRYNLENRPVTLDFLQKNFVCQNNIKVTRIK